jgi:23S rRNA (guanosine2251-2'-O)-methyltransferase
MSMPKNCDLIFGINPVFESLKASSQAVLEILLSTGSSGASLNRLRDEARRCGVRLVPVERRTLDRMAGGQRHQGVVARVQPYPYFPFADLIKRIAVPASSERILILDGLTDPRNFGALLRTADAAGVPNIIIPKDRSVDVTPVAAKASAGAAQHVQIVKVPNLRRAILDLKERDYWIAGLDARATTSIYETTFPERLAILIGSEGSGVRPINLRECDFAVSIPMLGRVSSLNVSVAGAVLLYELVRQRRGDGREPVGR